MPSESRFWPLWDSMSRSQQDRFKAYLARGMGLLLAGLVMELAVPLALSGQPSSPFLTNNTTSSLSGQAQALIDGILVLWNGVGIALIVLAVSAFYLTRSVLREASGGRSPPTAQDTRTTPPSASEVGQASTVSVPTVATKSSRAIYPLAIWVRCPSCGKPFEWPSETCERCGAPIGGSYAGSSRR